MGKYMDILEVKRENGRKKEEKQERLRQENGIKDKGYYLREKTWKSYMRDGAQYILYLIYVALAFIGAVMVLHPESRHLVLQLFHLA